MKKYLFILILFFISNFAFGQKANLTINEIDSIVTRIDSTCIRGGITDFRIEGKIKGRRKKIIGGGADWYYTDSTRTRLLKVVREVSLESENFDTYYFYHDSLIYLKTTNASRYEGKRIVNWRRECYFQGEKLVLNQDNLEISFDPKIYIKTSKEFFVGDQIWRK